ncbi:hypothetical protein JP0075_11150 [Helicobacter pylori]|nr:hypothetical protein JP0075_11150 [Helicobacter pylori]
MSKKIVVDPITRIEGHLRIEVIVDDDNVRSLMRFLLLRFLGG